MWPNNPPPKFFDLPAEIRDVVYDELPAPAQERVPIENMNLYYHTARLVIPSSILQVSHQMRAEALDTLRRHLHDPARTLHATLSLDLIHTGDDLNSSSTTPDMVFDVLECIDHHHMRSDQQVQAHLGTPHAPFIMDSQINTGRQGIYQAQRIHISSRLAFERFLERIILHACSNNLIAIELRATKSFTYDLFFAQQILYHQHAEVTLTICVETGPLVTQWRTAIHERINYPWRAAG